MLPPKEGVVFMELQRLVNDYVVWHEVSGHSEKTIGWYRWILSTFERWLKGNGRSTSINEITIADVRAFLQSEAQRDTLCPDHPTGVARAGRLSDRTLHCYARAIRAFFNWLVNEEYLTKNPVAKLKPPKLEKRYKEVLSVAEIERLLAELNQRTFLGARMYAIIALLYDSGLRAGELAGLHVGDVQWSEYQVRVMGKGKKERFVPFSPTTQKALRKYLTLREPFVQEGNDALFITAEGHRMTRESVTQAIKRLGRRAGIPRLHPHLLRHSAAVAAVMNGANQFELKRILGHTQLSTTDEYMDYAQQHLAQRHRHFSPMSKVSERSVASSVQLNRHQARSNNARKE
jgi:integrase/recombinase XerD